MSGKCLGGCPDFAKHYGLDFNCCSSCHNEDEEYTIRLSEHYVGDDFFCVCCAAKLALENKEAEHDTHS